MIKSKVESKRPAPLIFISLFLILIIILLIISEFKTYSTSRYDINFQLMNSFGASRDIDPYPSTMPEPTPKNLSKETIHKDNPSHTLAFYYTSAKPAFTKRGLEGNSSRYEDDPFSLMINGDANYFTQSAATQGHGYGRPLKPEDYIAIIKPMIVDLRTNSVHELKSVDRGMIRGNGFTQVLRWMDDTWLFSRSCGEGIGCDLDLINARDDVLVPYANIESFDNSRLNNKSRVKNYSFLQYCDDYLPCDIKVYSDFPIKISSLIAFNISSYTPIYTIKTTKYLNYFELDDANFATLNQRATFYLSKSSPNGETPKRDGYFIFDLVTGTIMESNNL